MELSKGGNRPSGPSTSGHGAENVAGARQGKPIPPPEVGQILSWPGGRHRSESSMGRRLEEAIAAIERRVHATQPARPTDLLRLGMTLIPLRDDGFMLTARYEDRVEIRVQPAAPGDAQGEIGLHWDVVGVWQPNRRPALHATTIDEWLGLPFPDALALVRGMINEAVAESRGPSAVIDGFTHHGRTILNPFRDAFGNETSPSSEYGKSYSAWRARSPLLNGTSRP